MPLRVRNYGLNTLYLFEASSRSHHLFFIKSHQEGKKYGGS